MDSTAPGFFFAEQIDGKCFTWGLNNDGQLLDGTTINKSSPVFIGAFDIDLYSINGITGYLLRNNNELIVWGNNSTGALGDNSTVSKSSPIFLDVTNFVANTYVLSPTLIGVGQYDGISTGHNYYLATANNTGIVHVWGLNPLVSGGNRMGYPTTHLSTPTIINANVRAASVIASNGYSAMIGK